MQVGGPCPSVGHHDILLLSVQAPCCPGGSGAARYDSTQEDRDGPVGVSSRVLHQASSTMEVATQSITHPSCATWHQHHFTARRAAMSAPLHTPLSRYQQLPGRYCDPEPRSREQFLEEAVLSSVQGLRMLQAAAQDTHLWHPPLFSPKPNNIERTFGRIKSCPEPR